MKQLFTLIIGIGLVCPVFSQIKTSSIEIDNVSSTTVDADFTPSTDASHSNGTSSLRWLSMYGGRILASSGSSSGFGFETSSTYDARHWITANDGGGNLNFRFANKFHNGAHTQTETGLAMHILWDNNDGQFHWKSTETSNAAGTNIGSQMREFVRISPTSKEWYFPLSDWTVKSESTIDGPRVEVNQITNRAGTAGPNFPEGLTSDSNVNVTGTVTATTVEATSVVKVGSSQLKKLNISGTSGAPGSTKDIVIHSSSSAVMAEVTIIGDQHNSKNEEVYWHGLVTWDNSAWQNVKAMTIASSKVSATALVSGGNVILRITDNSTFGYSVLRGSAVVHP